MLNFASFIIRRTKEEYKNIVFFPDKHKYSYFSVDFRLKIFLLILVNRYFCFRTYWVSGVR